MRKHPWSNLLAILLLWAFFAQMVTSMVVESPTVDEQAHLMRGYVYLERGDLRFKIGHPILANAVNALPLWALTDLSLPEAGWQEGRWGLFSDQLFWRPGNNVDLIFFLGRLPTVAIGMLFAALVFRWACHLWEGGSRFATLFRGWAGVIALALFVFDPTIVAHSRYTTDDVAVSFFCCVAAYGLWRYLETDRKRDLVLTGIAFGLAQGCKFSALLLVPVFVIIVGLWPFARSATAASRRRWLLDHAIGLLLVFAIGGLTLWGVYRFTVGPFPGRTLPVPAPGYFEDLIWEVKYFGREGYAFLCGEISSTGWWYYFPVAFIIKSSLPAILLVGTTLIDLCRCLFLSRDDREQARRLIPLLVPASAYFLSTLASPLNIGYRFFIPVLPYLYVLTGRLAVMAKRPDLCGQVLRLLLVGALAWSAGVALGVHPHYLAYFNELVGGPDSGWRYLVDSNIDWGQDLPTLHEIVEHHHLGRIKLGYFGTAHPSYYGLDFEPLPTWNPTPEQGNPLARTYYPHDPAPGVYAISATLLQGVVMGPEEWDTYAWFRDQVPFAKAGYSIFLYRVEPTGPPVDVSLSGLQVDELTPDTFSTFGTNDVRLRWFDARTSFVISAQPAWYSLGEDDLDFWGWRALAPCATATGSYKRASSCRLYPPDCVAHQHALAYVERLGTESRVWRSPVLVPYSAKGGACDLDCLTPSSAGQVSPLALPVNLGDQLQFLGYELQPHAADATASEAGFQASHFIKRGSAAAHSIKKGSAAAHSQLPQSAACTVLTAWQVTTPPDDPRAIFVHLLAPDGQVATQWDGLDVLTEGWREGDIILQVASLELPPGTACRASAEFLPGQSWLQTGVYNPATMERLPVLVDGAPVADRILLSPMEGSGP
jgi:hypothetical protein